MLVDAATTPADRRIARRAVTRRDVTFGLILPTIDCWQCPTLLRSAIFLDGDASLLACADCVRAALPRPAHRRLRQLAALRFLAVTLDARGVVADVGFAPAAQAVHILLTFGAIVA